MIPKSKRTSLQALDRKLWKLFSLFIRKRDCPEGVGRCITCGKPKPIEEMDASHFVGRRHKATKFNEQNVHAACRYCNRFNGGEQYAYGLAIDEKYGKGTAEQLYVLSRARGTKLTRDWYEEQIRHYSAILKSTS